MRREQKVAWVFLAPGLALASAQAQTAAAASSPRTLIASTVPASLTAEGEIVREIDDPHNGDRWLLERDPSHPGGPGLLRLVSTLSRGSIDTRQGTQAVPGVQTPAPVIHLGDRVIVEEHTPVVEARLEAVALSPAQVGSPLRVRLSVGGRTMRAVALGPGRAVFQEETR